MDERKLLRFPQVRERVGLSRGEIYRLMKAHPAAFPQPISLGTRALAWVSTDIDEWIAERIAKGREHQGERCKITEKATNARRAKRALEQREKAAA